MKYKNNKFKILKNIIKKGEMFIIQNTKYNILFNINKK